MNFGDSEVLREEGSIKLLEVGCRNGNSSYCVLGKGPTKHYDDYDDALEEFNLRWMKEQFD